MQVIRDSYPEAHITLMTSAGLVGLPGAKDVLGEQGPIDEIFDYLHEGRKSAISALLFAVRAKQFDVFIELPNDMASLGTLLRNMLFARLAVSGWARGWRINTIRIGLQAQSDFIDFPDEVKRLLDLVSSCGMNGQLSRRWLRASDSDIAESSLLLERNGVPCQARLVGLAPGAKRAGNRWPPERFAEIAEALTLAGFYVLLLGTAQEAELTGLIHRRVNSPRCIDLAGKTTVRGAFAVVGRCDLVLCNDSGLQHVSSATGVPCIAVFSSWQLRGKWNPHHPNSVAIRKPIPCHTCYLRECSIGDLCVKSVSVEDVSSAAFRVLRHG